MTTQTLNRYEWAKAVLQVEGLSQTAKNIASVLALQFYNDETGQLNPSQETLADYLKVHKDTVKRALRELRNAGWLMSVGDGGRGKAPMLRLLSPSKIIPFRTVKGGQNTPGKAPERGVDMHPQDTERGDDLQQKGGQILPPHNKEEQYKEQKEARPFDRWAKHRFTGSAWEGPTLVQSGNDEALYAWGRWLKGHGLPALCSLPIENRSEKGTVMFRLPWRMPPNDPRREAEALEYFTEMAKATRTQHAA